MFRKLISLDEARRILKQNFSPKPEVERVLLSSAYGRVLAEDVVAPMNVPPFDRSIVDGYAVRAVDTFGAHEDRPVALKLCGRVNTGEFPHVAVGEGTTAEIATGAPLPEGSNAVVMVEHSTQKKEDIFIYRPVSSGENIMEVGSDIQEKERILKRHKRLYSREIGLLAALGLTEVNVYKCPRVAVLSTGDEVVEPGKPLPPGKIFDVNAYTLSAAVIECGGEPVNLGVIPDTRRGLEKKIKEALGSADALITSGGVSVGHKDFIPQVVNTLGKPGVIVSGIAIKPGKPTTMAVIEGKPVFSLPGHPTSALLMFHIIVRSIILEMAGMSKETPKVVRAVAAKRVFSARGRRTFVAVNITHNEKTKPLAFPVPVGLSGAISTLAKADGFVEILEEEQFIDAGTEINVYLFSRKA